MYSLIDLRDRFLTHIYPLLKGGVLGMAALLSLQAIGNCYFEQPMPVTEAPRVFTTDKALDALIDAVIAPVIGPAPVTRPTVAQISVQRAADAGFLPVITWVCKAKQVPCEMLLAIAQLETSTGLQEKNPWSSARGLWQITDTQFIDRAFKYGPRNFGTIEAYLKDFNVTDPESRRTRIAYQHLVKGLTLAEDARYEDDRFPTYTKNANDEILKARDSYVIQALLVVDCQHDDVAHVAEQTELPPSDVVYLTHLLGGPVANLLLRAYGDKQKANQKIATILAAYYRKRDMPANARPAVVRFVDRKIAKNVDGLLHHNGIASNASVEQVVRCYIDKYRDLAEGIKVQLAVPQGTSQLAVAYAGAE